MTVHLLSLLTKKSRKSPHIKEDGTGKCSTYWLEKCLEQIIEYQSSWLLIF